MQVKRTKKHTILNIVCFISFVTRGLFYSPAATLLTTSAPL